MRKLLICPAVVAAGITIMYVEGRAQPEPGVGFAIGGIFIIGALLYGANALRGAFVQYMDTMDNSDWSDHG